MSELALKLIAENKRTRSPFLDLGNCGLTEVPVEIAELVWLEELSFASEWWDFEGHNWIRKKSQNIGFTNQLAHLTSTLSTQPLMTNVFTNLIRLRNLYLADVPFG